MLFKLDSIVVLLDKGLVPQYSIFAIILCFVCSYMFIVLDRLDYECYELLTCGMLIVVAVVQSLSTGSPRVRGGGNQSL